MRNEYFKLLAISWIHTIVHKRLCPCLSFDKFQKLTHQRMNTWLVGLGVWFSLRVREVPGSNPGRAPSCLLNVVHKEWKVCVDYTILAILTNSGVWFSLKVREVLESNPGWALTSLPWCRREYLDSLATSWNLDLSHWTINFLIC